jgi:hypothetical protein
MDTATPAGNPAAFRFCRPPSSEFSAVDEGFSHPADFWVYVHKIHFCFFFLITIFPWPSEATQ